MAKDRHLDDFIDALDFNNIIFNKTGGNNEGREGNNMNSMYFDDVMKQKILKKTKLRLRKKQTFLRYTAVACVLLMVISYFTPNTPVYALRQTILSYIPGIGVVQNNDDSDTITSVLIDPVKIMDGKRFVEIRAAFIKGNMLVISGLTNIEPIDAKILDNTKDYMEFFSGETTPGIYLVGDNDKIKAGHQEWAGPSYDKRISKMSIYFYLNEDAPPGIYHFEVDGFDKPIEIILSPVKAGSIPDEIGDRAVVDDVMAFAHTSREKDITEIMISIIAPNEYKDPRCYLFEHEKELFESGIYIADEKGVRYEPDDDLRESRNSGINTFYFRIAEDTKGLKLVIPQILFDMDYKENDIKINVPKENKEVIINKKIQLGNHNITLERASMILAGNDILPEGFESIDNIMINASTTTIDNSSESILRIVPHIPLSSSKFHYLPTSYSVHASFWDPKERSGYSFINFDSMQKTKKIIIDFSTEISMIGPWEIQLEEK